RVQQIETALEDGRKLCNDGRFAEAVRTFGRGIERASSVPAVEHLTRSLREQLVLARRGQKAAALHDLADLIRFRHGIDLPAADQARALERSIRVIWNERDLLLAPNARTPDPKTEQVIRADLVDLAIAWAELRVGLVPAAEADTAQRDALRILDLAHD